MKRLMTGAVGFALLMGCTTTQGQAMLHSVSMRNLGAPAYDFRIDYGEAVLPYGPNGDDEFAAGSRSVFSAEMAIPARVQVRWRTAPAPAGRELRYTVPLDSLVTRQQRESRFLTVGFAVSGDRLEVRVGKDAREARLSAPVLQMSGGEQ